MMEKEIISLAKALRKLGIFNCLFLIFISGCKNKLTTAQTGKEANINSELIFTPVKEFRIPLAGMQKLPPVQIQLIENGNVLSFLDFSRKKIILWDLNNNRLKEEIDVNRFPHRHYIQNYKILSKERIILTYNPTFLADYHDKAIVMINRNKKVIDSFNFKGAKVNLWGEEKWPLYQDYFLDFTFFPIIYKENTGNLVAPLASYENPCDSFYSKENLGLLGTVSSGKNYSKGFKNLDFEFPCHDYSKMFWSNAKYLRGAYDSKNDKLVVGVGHSNVVQLFDLNTGEKLVMKIPWSVSGRPFPLNDEKPPVYSLENPEYLTMAYDKEKSGYWFVARLKVTEENDAILNNYPIHELIFGTENLKTFSKGFLPFGYSKEFLPYKNGILCYNKFKSDQENEIIFSYLKVESKDFDTNTYQWAFPEYGKKINQLTNDSKINYLKNFDNSKEKFLIIPLESTCPPCLKKVLEFLGNNQGKYSQKLTVILIASNETIINEVMKAYNLSNENLVKKDFSSEWKNHFNKWVNPKIIRLNSTGEIVLEKNYDQGELPELFDEFEKS